jgi:glycyl-tRNA synthetase
MCPNCQGELGEARSLSTMFQVQIGPNKEEAYLRPETAQSIFVDFARLYKTMRVKLPFAIAQYGEVFRNEIAPRQGLIRLRELHQAEIEIFFNPNIDLSEEKFQRVAQSSLRIQKSGVKSPDTTTQTTVNEAYQTGLLPFRMVAYYLARLQEFYVTAGIPAERIRFRLLRDDEKAFYAKLAIDLEVKASLGWVELVACNYRADYDLTSHARGSGVDLSVLEDGRKLTPHVFELSLGVDRSIYTILELSYVQEAERTVLRLPRKIAPIEVAILPLVSKEGLPEKAALIHETLLDRFEITYDESGSIGRRYRRNDEIGVPAAITVDYQTIKDDTVTLRERDSMQQQRVSINELPTVLEQFLQGKKDLALTREIKSSL